MRSTKPNIIKASFVFVMFVILTLASPYIFNTNAFANGQETCPQTGDWVKVDGINSQSYTYHAPEGKLVVEVCYKAGTTVKYYTVDPGQTSVTVNTTVPNPNDNAYEDISHASFRLADKPQESKGSMALSGACQNDGSIKWTVTNSYGVPISFNWSSTNGQSGSGQAPANSSTTFSTSVSGNNVTISYTVDNQQKQIQKTISVCTQPEEGQVSLSGECLNNGFIQWTVNNTYGEAINFSWSANNNESGSNTVPANGSKTFTTSVSGNQVTITYSVNNEEKQLGKTVTACEAPKSGDVSLSGVCLNNGNLEWTVFNTTNSSVSFNWSTSNNESGSGNVAANSTLSFNTTEQGNNLTLIFSLDNQENQLSKSVDVCSQPQPKDTSPDVAAGGMGPSLVTSLAPFVTGFFGLGAASILTVKSKKFTK